MMPRIDRALQVHSATATASWLGLILGACGGGETPGSDAAIGPRPPPDLADDDRPYQLAASCAALPAWPELRALARVAAVSPREAWVVTMRGELYHLRPDGAAVRALLDGVTDVRRCPDATWAVGGNGLVARKSDGGDTWQRFDLAVAAPFTDVGDAGVGCDGDLWIGLGYAVHVHDGIAWRAIATEPTFFDPDNPAGGKIDHDAYVVRGAAGYRAAAGRYGETLAYFPERDAFGVVAGTDDAISDAIAFRDGAGATLYYGHALAFDRDEDHNDGDSPLDGVRAARRTDRDVWLARGDGVAHFDGAAVTTEAMPGFFDQDIDARADAVWAVGFDGAAVKTQEGWCHVLVTPRLP